jgi:hypothetical protein
MYSFEIDCPNEGLGRVMQALKSEGITSDSRNGPVIRFPKPVCLEYLNPRRRIMDSPIRDANHFFHLMETMWMFGGMNTVAPLDLFNSGFKQYSDDGVTFAAPYGYRWRHHFKFDQIKAAVEKLKANPQDRRVVVQMWDPEELKKADGKDFACNQNIMFDTRPVSAFVVGGAPAGHTEFALDMTVTNRSNDLIYGAMGSNLFHMSLLHEYVAYHAGLSLGTYYQFSKNMHLYLENDVSKRCWEQMNDFGDYVSPETDTSLSEHGLTLYALPIKFFVETHRIPDPGYGQPSSLDKAEEHAQQYLGTVVKPIVEAYKIYKLKTRTGIETPPEARVDLAVEILSSCKSDPLRRACEGWLADKLSSARNKRRPM